MSPNIIDASVIQPGLSEPEGAARRYLAASFAYCCFSQNDSKPCEAEPPITQGMPIAI